MNILIVDNINVLVLCFLYSVRGGEGGIQIEPHSRVGDTYHAVNCECVIARKEQSREEKAAKKSEQVNK